VQSWHEGCIYKKVESRAATKKTLKGENKMNAQEQQQVEGMKKVLNGPKGIEARESAEKRQKYLIVEIKAMKKLNEEYNIERLAKFESQLNVINASL
jgi:hypothetical protein